MKNLQIYVDTSVLGGCFEPEFHLPREVTTYGTNPNPSR